MRLLNITARAHPNGNRIDLHFLNPQPHHYTKVSIRRDTQTHPRQFTDGQLVAEVKMTPLLTWVATSDCIAQLDQQKVCTDLNNQLWQQQIFPSPTAVITTITTGQQWQLTDTEQTYRLYYQAGALKVYLYQPSIVIDQSLQSETVYYYTFFTFPDPSFDPDQRATAMATAPYRFGGQFYDLLPNLYHRYDTQTQLRRFLDLPGSQLDQIYSFARALLDLYHLDHVDGRLLPLLAQWIGWQLDRNQAMSTWRNEIRYAPYLYKTIGIIPTVESTIKRLLDWESNIKEYQHNVFRTNMPERFNLWQQQGDAKPQLLSLDFAYEGRPTLVIDDQATHWLFYHTPRNQHWEIWYKTLTQDQWSPSQPLVATSPLLNKHPTAVWWQGQIWVFWNAYDNHHWQIHYCHQSTTTSWSSVYQFNAVTEPIERRQPAAVVDDADQLWLFWLERQLTTTPWELKYHRLDNSTDGRLAAVTGTRLETAGSGIQDLFVLFHPQQQLWVFWSQRQVTTASVTKATAPAKQQPVPCRQLNDQPPHKTQPPHQTHWQITYRVKNLATDNWETSQTLPRLEPGYYDDREPAALINNSQKIELFWSSNRGGSHSGGSWSIWQQTLDPSTGWIGTPQALTHDPYSQRTPLPLVINNTTQLIYRTNAAITYQTERYGATQTTDFRYAGCTSVDTCNLTKLSLRDQLADFQSYTFDTGYHIHGHYDHNRYAAGRIGIYLTPNTQGYTLNRRFLNQVLAQFLPIQVRPIFFVSDPGSYQEWVYTYEATEAIKEQIGTLAITEQFNDALDKVTTTDTYDTLIELTDNYQDTLPEWTWLYTAWTQSEPNNPWTPMGHRTVNFGPDSSPPLPPLHITRFRSWHIGITQAAEQQWPTPFG